jgi:hypothetical protein
MKIAILTPSRNRPAKLIDFNYSVCRNAFNPWLTTCYTYIDPDEPNTDLYFGLNEHLNKTYKSVIIQEPDTEPQSVSKTWNILAFKAIEDGADVLIMGNDDVLYRTESWDKILREHIDKYTKDGIYCMWFEDLINGPNHCAFPIVSKKWVETLGYFTPGIFNFGYNDTWVFDIAKRIDRTHFIPEVVNEHMHFTTGKSKADATTRRNRTEAAGNLYAKDKILFEQTENLRIEAANKLKEVMNVT